MSDKRIIGSNNIYFSCLFPEDEVYELRMENHVLIHVISGQIIIDDHNCRRIVNAGETVFERRDHEVRVTKHGVDGVPYSAVSVVFDREFLKRYHTLHKGFESIADELPRLHQSAIMLEQDEFISKKLLSLQKYIGADDLPDKDECTQIKSEVLDCLLIEHPELYPVLFDFNEKWKIDILKFMEKNFRAQLSISEFARYTGRSLAGFKRDFSKISALTPQKWIIEHRLDDALKLIVKEKIPVTDACYQSGFKNRTHFIRAFKERFGVIPSVANLILYITHVS